MTALKMFVAIAMTGFAASSHAVLVLDYEFNGAAGALSTAFNSGVGSTVAPWSADADATLNGNGQLVTTGQLNSQTHQLTSASEITSGSAFLRIDLDSWGSALNPFFAFGMRASGPGTPTTPISAIPTWRLQFSSGDSSDNNPLGRLLELSGSSFLRNPTTGMETNRVLDSTIPASSGGLPGGLSVIMGVDLDNDTSSIWLDEGRTGTYQVFAMRNNNPISSSAGFTNFNKIDAIILQSGNSGQLFGIDRVVLGTDFTEIATMAAIPEPSVVLAFSALSTAIAVLSRRSSARAS